MENKSHVVERTSEFDIDEYIRLKDKSIANCNTFTDADLAQFHAICSEIDIAIKEFESKENQMETTLQRQKDAIVGREREVAFYTDKIKEILMAKELAEKKYPPWYENLADGIFQELFGIAGVSEWLKGKKESLKTSSSAKVLGDNIFFLINGKQVLQPQRINAERRNQLRQALLLLTPKKRPHDSHHEVYLQDGTRVTIFNEGITKKGQDCIVFRKFFIPEYTFEQQAQMGTIPEYAIPLFRLMIAIGYNVAFTGAVRTAKTTFLTTWQLCEDPSLEGVMVETDPEIPLHRLMPGAPIMQLVPDEDKYRTVIKNIMRSDADYIIVAEARDGIALNMAVVAANKGTSRVKMTYHTTDAEDFCKDVAETIAQELGVKTEHVVTKVAKSFQYVFQFVQLPDKSKKRLNGIWKVIYMQDTQQIIMDRICKYNYTSDDWGWKFSLHDTNKKTIGEEEDPERFQQFSNLLMKIASEYPMDNPKEHKGKIYDG